MSELSSATGLDGIFTGIKNISLTELKRHAKAEQIELSADEIEPEGPVLDYWMGIILLAGNQLKLTFKVYYNTDDCRPLTAARTKRELNQVSDELVADFIREYCNLAGGATKRLLSSFNIPIGLSLPLVTRGFDDVFVAPKKANNSANTTWKLTTEGGNEICIKVIVDVLDWNALNSVKYNAEEDSINNGVSTLELF